ETLVELAQKQCKKSHRKICGQVIYVPIVEAPGQTGVGRRLEGPARQPAVILRRCLSERKWASPPACSPMRLPSSATRLPNPTIKQVLTAWTMSTILPASSAPPKLRLATRSWRTPSGPQKG